MRTYPFEKLTVWQKSRKLPVVMCTITKSFLENERYGLIRQMRRGAVSISSNIVEGTGRRSAKDKARSALELLNQAILSYNLEFVSKE